jgi:arylsulfatase
VIEPGTIVNEILASEDWVPTLVAAAGDPDVKEKLLTGRRAGDNKTFKNYLDGYNFMPYFTDEVDEGPRHEWLILGSAIKPSRCGMADGGERSCSPPVRVR